MHSPDTCVTEFAADLLQLLYFMAPAYLANMAPPFARFWHGWNRPIHAPALGNHKTVVGFALGVILALATTAVQALIDAPYPLVDYSRWPWLGLGFGVGAMVGDCLKSYLKRRRGKPPGASWFPFDQLDFVVGALVLVGPAAALDVGDVVIILAMSLAGDIVVNRIAYRLGIKTSPW
jgi:CDP-2,3-bis-(O-geranylgeranyl)-sn-glycerol synthase